jgi:hypothetical protein
MSQPSPKPDPRTLALLQSGEAMDAAMMQLVTHEHIGLLSNAELVDKMHQALNAVVAITGTPWRK